MATGREYLESIISQCADMQRWTDPDLDMLRDELAAIDDRLPSDWRHVEEMREEAQQAAARTEPPMAPDVDGILRELAPDPWEQQRRRPNRGGGLILDGGVWG